jgi:hypothetical protein
MSRRVAASFVFAYIAIQTFQEIVFRILGEPSDAAGELQQGPAPLNLARASLMLVSFFGLAFAYLVVCAHDRARRPLASAAACLALLAFCLLEIGLRSVELFWAYIGLPDEFARAPAIALDKMATFQAIQAALYIPLMLSKLLGSAILAVGFPRTPRRNLLVVGSMGIDAARLACRLAGTLLHISALDVLSGPLYLPLVVVTNLPLAIWLWREA